MIQSDRLWKRIQEVGKIGRQETGGVTRLAFSPEERSAKELAASFMKEAGLAVREDEAGNLIGRCEGTLPGAPVVMIGSHLDSVYNGGDFDGPLGVLAGVEVLQAMQEQGIQTLHPIEVIAFTDEEGARFSFGMLGSRALAGTVKSSDLAYRDQTGISIADAMSAYGLSPERLSAAKRSPESVKAYVELHIEQGKVLEANGFSVGIVSGIAGPLWLKFTVEGEAGHAGTTPMPLRHDPLAAAAKIMTAIEEEASAAGTTVGTVGQLQLFPGGINIIPKRVEFSLDLRDIDESVRDRAEQKILQRAASICEQAGVHLQIELLQRVPPVPCSNHVQAAAEAAFETAGFQPFRLISGAGHDGMQLKDLCPIGMIFVRSKDGISHNPAEWSSQADCADGAKALYYTVLNLAKA